MSTRAHVTHSCLGDVGNTQALEGLLRRKKENENSQGGLRSLESSKGETPNRYGSIPRYRAYLVVLKMAMDFDHLRVWLCFVIDR